MKDMYEMERLKLIIVGEGEKLFIGYIYLGFCFLFLNVLII